MTIIGHWHLCQARQYRTGTRQAARFVGAVLIPDLAPKARDHAFVLAPADRGVAASLSYWIKDTLPIGFRSSQRDARRHD